MANRLFCLNKRRFPADVVKENPKSGVHLDPDTYRGRSRISLGAADVPSSRCGCAPLSRCLSPANSTSEEDSWAIWNRRRWSVASTTTQTQDPVVSLSGVFLQKKHNPPQRQTRWLHQHVSSSFQNKISIYSSESSTWNRIKLSQHIRLDLELMCLIKYTSGTSPHIRELKQLNRPIMNS